MKSKEERSQAAARERNDWTVFSRMAEQEENDDGTEYF